MLIFFEIFWEEITMNFLSKRAKRQQVYSVQNKALLLTLSFISFSSIYFFTADTFPTEIISDQIFWYSPYNDTHRVHHSTTPLCTMWYVGYLKTILFNKIACCTDFFGSHILYIYIISTCGLAVKCLCNLMHSVDIKHRTIRSADTDMMISVIIYIAGNNNSGTSFFDKSTWTYKIISRYFPVKIFLYTQGI